MMSLRRNYRGKWGIGKDLSRMWRVDVEQALYRSEGNWYNDLTKFPAALFDDYGYIRIDRKEDLLSIDFVSIGKQINFNKGKRISDIPGYVKVIN